MVRPDPAGGHRPAGAASKSRTVTALVVDDQRTFADAVALALDSQPGLRCVGSVGSVDEALAVLARGCPDVVLLDIQLPRVNGVEAIGLLRELCPTVRVIIVTAHPAPATLVAAIRAGADGFLPKDTPFRDILQAVRQTDEQLLVDHTTLDMVVHTEQAAPRDHGRPPHLTPRESQVLHLLADGRPVKQIARQLQMSVHTCRGHVRSLLSKLEVHSQLAAVVQAARLGLLVDTSDGRVDGGARP